MNKIIFYIVANSKDNPQNIFETENKNNLINKKSGKYYFKTKSDESILIDVECKSIEFNNELAQNLMQILKRCIKEAKLFSEKKLDFNLQSIEKMNSIIKNVVNRSSLENPSSIFEFVGLMFARLLMNHTLTDGNKRLSFAFLRSCLRFFGYFLLWTDKIPEGYQKNKTQIEEFIISLQSGWNINSPAFKQIIKWIKNETIISYKTINSK